MSQPTLSPPKLHWDSRRVSRCQANEDDCTYEHCPRWRDGEIINHAHCALDRIPDEEDDK
jgi:hypothetical protein